MSTKQQQYTLATLLVGPVWMGRCPQQPLIIWQDGKQLVGGRLSWSKKQKTRTHCVGETHCDRPGEAVSSFHTFPTLSPSRKPGSGVVKMTSFWMVRFVSYLSLLCERQGARRMLKQSLFQGKSDSQWEEKAAEWRGVTEHAPHPTPLCLCILTNSPTLLIQQGNKLCLNHTDIDSQLEAGMMYGTFC